MSASFETRAADSYAVSGPLTFETVTAVWQQSLAALRGPGTVHIDLSQVSRTDSAGLALIIEWLRAARQSGGKLLFGGPPEQMRQLAEACHLEELLKRFTA